MTVSIPRVEFEERFSELLPEYRLLLIATEVEVHPAPEALTERFHRLAEHIASTTQLPDINKIPAIAATRRAYKLCGKDPNRYRPSQEQLLRRIVRGLGLYSVNNVVDCGNMLSLTTGCSVGCFDSSAISGDTITVGIGKAGEPYEGIGRGEINIEGMPLLRDAIGPFATPTSDTPRTSVGDSTRRLLLSVHLYDPAISPDEVVGAFESIFEPTSPVETSLSVITV